MKIPGSITLTVILLLVAVSAGFFVLVVQARSDRAAPGATFDLSPATSTPIPIGVTPAGIPLIQLPLATPESGKGHVTGRVLCNGRSQRFQVVYLIWIEGASFFSILRADYTDEAGRWFFGNLSPGTYAVSGEMPRSLPNQLFVINAEQVTEFGDLNLAPSLCN